VKCNFFWYPLKFYLANKWQKSFAHLINKSERVQIGCACDTVPVTVNTFLVSCE
jgi:hypothetical protein